MEFKWLNKRSEEIGEFWWILFQIEFRSRRMRQKHWQDILMDLEVWKIRFDSNSIVALTKVEKIIYQIFFGFCKKDFPLNSTFLAWFRSKRISDVYLIQFKIPLNKFHNIQFIFHFCLILCSAQFNRNIFRFCVATENWNSFSSNKLMKRNSKLMFFK